MTRTIIDSGALVALVRKRDQYHSWARKQLNKLTLPYCTSEAVLSEVWYLLETFEHEQEKLLKLIEKKDVAVDFDLSAEIDNVISLLRQYSNVPMSVADGCIVRMSELHKDSIVFSTDSDFRIYRRYGNQIIPAILP